MEGSGTHHYQLNVLSSSPAAVSTLDRDHHFNMLCREGDRRDLEIRRAEMMTKPVSRETAYRWFGFEITLIPMGTTLAALLGHINGGDSLLFVFLFALAASAAAALGYFSGGLVSRAVGTVSHFRTSSFLSVLPFLGLAWGASVGALSGVFLYMIGSIFGAIVGGLIGAASFPIFVILHRTLSEDGRIELKHLLPIVVGIPAVVAAYLLGLFL